MTPQQIVGLGLRLLALLLALNALRYFGFTAMDILPTEAETQEAVAQWIAAIYFIAAALLWLLPMWLAHQLLPRTKFDNKLEVHGHELACVGCSLIGLWLFASALPNTIWYLFRAFIVTGEESFFRMLPPDAKLELLTSGLQVVLAVVLITRSADFASIVLRANGKPIAPDVRDTQ